MGNFQAVLDEFAYMIDERDAKDRNAKKIQKRMIDSFIDRNYQESDPYVYTWNDIFKLAGKEAKDKGFCDLVPYWSIPQDMLNAIDGSEMEAIESIVPLYPLSMDYDKYRHMKSVLRLYRLTMGQPRQEELLELFKDMTKEDIDQLLFNLSPIKRKK